MPAHRKHTRRSLGYPIAGLTVAAALLFVGGPQAAKALTRTSAAPAPTTSAAPVPTATTASPAPSESPSPVSAAVKTGPLKVVGLGDSVPAGSACGCTSYVNLVGAHEAATQHTSADVSNLAVGGYTTSDVLDQLTDSSVKKSVAAADLVIITIGANDFSTDGVGDQDCSAPGLDCFQSTLQTQQSQLDALFTKVNALIGDQATVLVTGYWNVFLDGDVAAARGRGYVANSIALTKAENAQIASLAQAKGATYADIFTPFKGTSGTADDTNLLASDGDHPNAAGHRLIATTLEGVLDAD